MRCPPPADRARSGRARRPSHVSVLGAAPPRGHGRGLPPRQRTPARVRTSAPQRPTGGAAGVTRRRCSAWPRESSRQRCTPLFLYERRLKAGRCSPLCTPHRHSRRGPQMADGGATGLTRHRRFRAAARSVRAHRCTPLFVYERGAKRRRKQSVRTPHRHSRPATGGLTLANPPPAPVRGGSPQAPQPAALSRTSRGFDPHLAAAAQPRWKRRGTFAGRGLDAAGPLRLSRG
jgi:hypothetical protein